MDTHKTLQELIEERRAAWSTVKSPFIAGFTANPEARTVEDPGLGELEDTRPLSPYRPERL